MNMTADEDVIIYHDEQTIIQMIEKHPAGKGATKLKRIDRWRNALRTRDEQVLESVMRHSRASRQRGAQREGQ